MTLFEIFFNNRNEQLNKIELLQEKHNLHLLDKLKNENRNTEFLSLVSEINFALFFDEFASHINRPRIGKSQTPDWEVTMNNQKVILEVMRLNPSAKDKKELDFEDDFFDVLQKIRVGCFLGFEYINDETSRFALDIQQCRLLVEDWLKEERQQYETLSLFNAIEIEFHKYSSDVDHVCLAGGGGGIDFNFNRLRGDKSNLVNKINKYRDGIALCDLHVHRFSFLVP